MSGWFNRSLFFSHKKIRIFLRRRLVRKVSTWNESVFSGVWVVCVSALNSGTLNLFLFFFFLQSQLLLLYCLLNMRNFWAEKIDISDLYLKNAFFRVRNTSTFFMLIVKATPSSKFMVSSLIVHISNQLMHHNTGGGKAQFSLDHLRNRQHLKQPSESTAEPRVFFFRN